MKIDIWTKRNELHNRLVAGDDIWVCVAKMNKSFDRFTRIQKPAKATQVTQNSYITKLQVGKKVLKFSTDLHYFTTEHEAIEFFNEQIRNGKKLFEVKVAVMLEKLTEMQNYIIK